MAHPLTKSQFLTGLRCQKALWWTVHEPLALELKPDENAQMRMEMGKEVGMLAREYVPGGVAMPPAYLGVAARVEKTREAMQGGASVIYEATFEHDGLAVSVDILERDGDGWRIIEVKSASSVKDEHIEDAAYQAWIARQAGINVTGVEIMHLCSECRFPDLSNLFQRDDVSERAAELQPDFDAARDEIALALSGSLPTVELGTHCISPSDCEFKARCWVDFPEHHVSTIYYGKSQWFAWAEKGYHTIHDLPANFKVSRGGKPAARQLAAVRQNRMIVEAHLPRLLDDFKSPLAFLDFETVQPAIPVWNQTKPWAQLPVQFSCHIEDGAGGYRHYEWLAESADDKRRELAEQVIESCRGAGAVVAYNMSFEKQCLEQMADAFPELADGLTSVVARMVDLLPVMRDCIYHPDFGGSFSLKKVLAPILGDDAYAPLAISDGSLAMARLYRMLFKDDPSRGQARERLRADLLAYCKADTWEMVRLLGAVRGLAVGGRR